MMEGLSIILPTYKEGKNLPHLLKRLANVCRRFKNYEIIIVDDNSNDGTQSIAKDFQHVRLYTRKEKLGLASGVVMGIKKSKFSIICVMDADLQHPPELIPKMFNEIKNADIVIANRFHKNSKVIGLKFHRLVQSKVYISLLRMIFPRIFRIKDPLSGFFMIKKSIIKISKLKGYGFKILLEILMKSRYNTAIEIPFTFNQRFKGESKLNFKEYLLFLRLFFDILFPNN